MLLCLYIFWEIKNEVSFNDLEDTEGVWSLLFIPIWMVLFVLFISFQFFFLTSQAVNTNTFGYSLLFLLADVVSAMLIRATGQTLQTLSCQSLKSLDLVQLSKYSGILIYIVLASLKFWWSHKSFTFLKRKKKLVWIRTFMLWRITKWKWKIA